MPDVPSFEEIYEIGKTEVQSRNEDLTDWEDGSNDDAMIGGFGAMVDLFIGFCIKKFANQFASTAESMAAAEAIFTDRYGADYTHKAANAAVGTLTFTRGAGVGDIEVPAGTECEAEVNGEKVTFTTDSVATILAAGTSVDVLATCTITGRSGNVAQGVIDEILDTLVDDSTATVTNAARFAGGAPEETLTEYIQRMRKYHEALQRGIKDAIEAAALNVAGVSYATADESTVPDDEGGYVSLYIGDPDGSGNDVLAAAVDAIMIGFRACGMQVVVYPSAQEIVSKSITVYIASGADKTALDTSIRTNVLQYINTRPPNTTGYDSKIRALAHDASEYVLKVVSDDSSDLVPTEKYNAIRMYESGLSITYVEVA